MEPSSLSRARDRFLKRVNGKKLSGPARTDIIREVAALEGVSASDLGAFMARHHHSREPKEKTPPPQVEKVFDEPEVIQLANGRREPDEDRLKRIQESHFGIPDEASLIGIPPEEVE